MKAGLQGLSGLLESATKAIVTEQEVDDLGSEETSSEDDEDMLSGVSDDCLAGILVVIAASHQGESSSPANSGENLFDHGADGVAEAAAFVGRLLVAKKGRVTMIAKKIERRQNAAKISAINDIKGWRTK